MCPRVERARDTICVITNIPLNLAKMVNKRATSNNCVRPDRGDLHLVFMENSVPGGQTRGGGIQRRVSLEMDQDHHQEPR